MKNESALTVIISVFNDAYCDLYLFNQEQKKLCANLMSVKTFNMFAKNLMSYPLMRKIEDPNLNLASLVRNHINNQFVRINDLNIKSYIDMPQEYDLLPMITVENNLLDEVWLCDFRIGNNFYVNNDKVFDTYRQRPSLYRADETVCDDDCSFDLAREELDDVISTVKRCGDEIESYNDLSLFAVRDDRRIEVCPFSIGNKDYFIKKAREHADDDDFLRHKTYVYEYNKGKTNKVYGCTKFEKHENVVELDLEKDNFTINTPNKEDNDSKDYSLGDMNNPFRTNHYELFIDNNEDFRLACTGIDLSYKENYVGRIIAKFCYTKKTSLYFNDDTDAFKIGTEHEISLRLHSPDASETHYLVENEIFVLKEKRILLGSESDVLCFELVFKTE